MPGLYGDYEVLQVCCFVLLQWICLRLQEKRIAPSNWLMCRKSHPHSKQSQPIHQISRENRQTSNPSKWPEAGHQTPGLPGPGSEGGRPWHGGRPRHRHRRGRHPGRARVEPRRGQARRPWRGAKRRWGRARKGRGRSARVEESRRGGARVEGGGWCARGKLSLGLLLHFTLLLHRFLLPTLLPVSLPIIPVIPIASGLPILPFIPAIPALPVPSALAPVALPLLPVAAHGSS